MPKKKRNILNSSRSYTSLAYGVLTVIILFVIIFFSVRAISQRTGVIDDESANTMQVQTAYEVKEGDTLWSIAEAQYKDGYKWVEIVKANSLANPDSIEAGQKLSLPTISPAVSITQAQVSPSPSITATPPVSAGSAQKITANTYTVVAGDNLWEIAVRAYGDGYKWPEIARINKLTNPDLIYPGNKFTLPR